MIKYSLFILLLLFIDPGTIGKINKAKAEAKEAYMRGDFKRASELYSLLVDSLGVKEDEVKMNLANSYFELNDTARTESSYLPLTTSPNQKLKSVANQQLGVVANRKKNFEEALNYFKNALKADPTNSDARYNYEMVKKKLDEKKKEEEKKDQQNKDKKQDEKKDDQKDKKDQEKKDQEKKDQEKKDQEKKDQQNKDQKDKDQKDQKDQEQKDKEQQEKEKQEKEQKEKENKDEKDKKEVPPSVSKKMKEMKISEDKARMVLEAMKNQEVQYLQQNKRKATKPKSKGKPDW